MTGLLTILASALLAQPVSYLTIPASVPLTPSGVTTTITPIYAALPGYGLVQVSFCQSPPGTPCVPPIGYSDQTATFASPGGFVGTYTWGTSATDLNMFNTTGSAVNYTVTFTFLSGPPDPTQLLLVVAGLDDVTTAILSQEGTLLGQDTFPSSPPSAATCLGAAYSTTSCPTIPSTGTVVYSDYYASRGVGDHKNTGWALIQMGPIDLVSGIPTLTVLFDQDPEDGIGFTLGYSGTDYLEVCKSSSTTNPVPANGIYSFTVTGSAFSSSTTPLMVPVGECSGPIEVSAPTSTITELPQPGVGVSAISAVGYSAPPNSQLEDLLESYDLQTRTATVLLVPPPGPGDTSTETIATFTNYEAPPGQLKVCKIAGSGVTVGTSFTFSVNGGTGFPLGAGPLDQGGYCKEAGTFPVGTSVTVSETFPSGGYAAPAITVNGVSTPSAGCTPIPRCVLAEMGPGINEVSFTNSVPKARALANPFTSLDMVNYSLVRQVAVTGTQSYMTYRADLLNTGRTTMGPMTASLTSLDPSSIQVIGQGELNFASAPANGRVASSSTFTVLTNPAVPLDFSKLSWTYQSTRSISPGH